MKNLIQCAVICLIIVLGGCSPKISKVLWEENGQKMGMLIKQKTESGYTYTYRDLSDLVSRVEKRDATLHLLPGASVTKFKYDSGRRIIEEKFLDMNLKPARCENGYFISKFSYTLELNKIKNVVKEFFDVDGKPVCTTSGFARIRFFYEDSDAYPTRIEFEDESDKVATCEWDGIKGVSKVKFSIIEGIGLMRFGVYYNAKGEVIERMQLSGNTSYNNEYTYYHYYYPYSYSYSYSPYYRHR